MPVTGKPLNEIKPTLTRMGKAALQAETATVRRMTLVGTQIVDEEGRKFHIRSGRTGQRYPLEGRGDVKTFGSREGQPIVRGAIRGVPEGFWKIITDGSRRHLITTRMARNETRRLKTGALKNVRSSRRQSLMFDQGKTASQLGRGLRPIRTPYGPRQYAVHPGHRQIGQPWEASMRRVEMRLPQVQQAESARRLIDAFTGRR